MSEIVENEKLDEFHLSNIRPENVYGESPIFEDEVARYHFDYIRPDEKTQGFIENARADFKHLLKKLHSIEPSRERAMAITALEKSLVFATKAIVVNYKQEQLNLEMDFHNKHLEEGK